MRRQAIARTVIPIYKIKQINNMTINDKQSELVMTARTAGIWYLIMAISGILGFLIFHAQVFDSEDSQKTLTNLIDLEALARTRLLLEFAIIASQALTAVWLYKLFRNNAKVKKALTQSVVFNKTYILLFNNY